MALSPEEQAKAATRIGELEQQVAEQAGAIRRWEASIDTLPRSQQPTRLEDIVTARDVLRRMREDANTLRAQIGLPLVIPDPLPPLPTVEPPGQPASKAARNGFFALIGAVMIVLFVLSRLGAFDRSPPTYNTLPAPAGAPAIDPAPVTDAISYFVSGTATRASLTYENANGGTEQHEVALPWHLNFVTSPGAYLYLSAQNQTDNGTIDCAILSGAQTVQRATSSGGYTIASCSGKAP